MKKEIIIFKDQKPTKEEICHSIEHFCMDHSIDCICGLAAELAECIHKTMGTLQPAQTRVRWNRITLR